ncbi:alpha/beta hydrolase [Tundrisphaera lichenicola]|uniref:alpha/beta hydrolase n=1 Tax=Tundrisphaera lichenicola TaxID=2029860 RepID=UPI003EC14EFE
MNAYGRPSGPTLAAGRCLAALFAICCSIGCLSPRSGHPSSTDRESYRPTLSIPSSPGPVIVDTPRGDDDREIVLPASQVETWIVHTRACEQSMGSNPWPAINVGRLDEQGGPLRAVEPEGLLSRMTGRPTVFLIHGYGYTHKVAVEETIQVRAQLETLGGLGPDHLFVMFDWPSERAIPGLIRDLNEKARRSRIAGYHLARFLQAAPEGSRVCLLGQSDGGRVALTSLHLLSGSVLPEFGREPSAQLSSGRADLRLRAVALEAAIEHDWLNPGDRLGGALPISEAFLNLYNSRDSALSVYALGQYTGFGAALGRVGFKRRDLERLGPLRDRVEQIDIHPMAGSDHSLYTRALTFPIVAGRVADFASWRELDRHGPIGFPEP